MPFYYCDTCQKELLRNEQRHNQESSGPVIIGQLNNIPTQPLVGFHGVRNVVRCITCGSDARIAFSEEEQKQSNLRARLWARFSVWALILAIVISVIIIGVAFYSAVKDQRIQQKLDRQDMEQRR